MATAPRGNILEVSGKLGNLVVCFRHGRYYVRTRPAKVNQPNTPAQLTHRRRFTMMQDFLRAARPFIQIGFAGYATGRITFNAAMSFNLRQAISGFYPDLTLHYDRVLLSKGLLPPPSEVHMARTAPGEVHFTWKAGCLRDVADTGCKAAIVVVAPEHNDCRWALINQTGLVMTHTLHLPPEWLGSTVHGYLSLMSNQYLTGKINPAMISDSVYAGSITV